MLRSTFHRAQPTWDLFKFFALLLDFTIGNRLQYQQLQTLQTM